MNLRVPQNAGNFLSSCTIRSFSRWAQLHEREIIRIMKLRRMKRAGHIARMGRRRMRIGFWWESQKERGQ
jgi:hypothetical protein